MIPKKIHYCWFGKNPKGKLIEECLATWRKHCPDYEIIEWNEDNFDFSQSEYMRRAYVQKKWAFVSDIARLEILKKEGGIYLDTDMFLLKSFDEFLNNKSFFGYEDSEYISAGVIGAEPENDFINLILAKYENINSFISIPKIITEAYQDFEKKDEVKIYPVSYFYPYSAKKIAKFNKNSPPKESYAVHLWNYSWGHPLVKILKQIGLFEFLNNFIKKIGLKDFIKIILKSE